MSSPSLVIAALFAAFNSHDLAALQRLYAPQAVLTSSDFCQPRTGADVTRTYRALFESFPEIQDEVDTVIVQKDRAAVRFTSQSKEFKMRLVTFFRFDGQGKIIEDDTVFDNGGRPCEP